MILKSFVEGCALSGIFRNEPTSEFSETPSFTPKTSWKPPKGHPSNEVFSSEIEEGILLYQIQG